MDQDIETSKKHTVTTANHGHKAQVKTYLSVYSEISFISIKTYRTKKPDLSGCGYISDKNIIPHG